MTLNKDNPELMERIENSYTLKQDIKDAICNPENMDSDLTDKIIEAVASHVNQNYTFNGI